ncbi:MAG TPA: enoyl-CoA hydratase/isomerase family protein [Micromonosporaceae bacterium]
MSDSGVRLDRDGPVATVTLCRPHVLNAQTPALWAELRTIAGELSGEVRVVVVRGEGRAFSAGLDLAAVRGETTPGGYSFAELARLPEPDALAAVASFQEAFAWLRRPDLVSIAAVQGHAIGAGFQLALACDLRILAADAQLTMAEVALGLVPDLGGTKRLVELVGYARAMDICLTGRRVGAAEADRLGLATSVVAPDDLDRTVADLTAQILSAHRDAIVEIKALLTQAADRTFADQERAEREAQVRRIRDLIGQGD